MKSSKYAIAIVCMLLSFFVTIQAKSIVLNDTSNKLTINRAEDLQIELSREQQKNEELYAELLKYREDLDQYSKQADEAGGYSKILAERLEEVSILAGLTDVYGQGVEIVLKDSKMINNDGLDENNFLIHDEDLLRLINELRDAGAEAISINGERILATSEIRCSGSTVSVNNTRYSAPYKIKAIGSSEDMKNALTMRQGVVDILNEWGIEVEITQKENITIEAYNGVISHKYAKPESE